MAADGPEGKSKRRKLRALVITMGGDRQKHIEEMFAHPCLSRDFEPPAFSPGVPSRSLRNRNDFFRIVNEAGLLPEAEWGALQKAAADETISQGRNTNRYFEYLRDIPITTAGRRGSQYDLSVHYSVELWKKAKTINRGRAVLACILAHLIALKRLVNEGFDVLLEDNVRTCPETSADRIWNALRLSEAWRASEEKVECHLRYFGWLGSVPNLQWIYTCHLPRTAFCSDASKGQRLMPFPRTQDIICDLENQQSQIEEEDENGTENKSLLREPGGNPVWGAYGYWISKEAYDSLIEHIRKDVGSLMWKSKRMRYYKVKPIDKIIPRCTMEVFGQRSVHLTTHPAFFRAPMLTSKIHTQWDPEFCKSTVFQLGEANLAWSDLWLTEVEKQIVDHYLKSGEWLTITELHSGNEVSSNTI